MQRVFAKILVNMPLESRFSQMTFEWDPIQAPGPGQFLTIRVSDKPVPLLRRPFAFSGFSPVEMSASIIFKQRGIATDMLSRMREGESLDIIGPLGNTFPAPDPEREPILLAGGIGLGPMLYLARTFRNKYRNMRFIFGCRTADDLPSQRELQEEQKGQGEPRVTDPIICTDDGSVGFKGTVIDCLEQLIDPDPSKTELYACGPIPMLKAAAGYARDRNIRCWVSMEQIMGCAMGACMGCVIKTVKSPGYARVCLEGPVFDSAEILWE